MTDSSKPRTKWAPKCPKCPEKSQILDERRSRFGQYEGVRLVLTCQNGHSWSAEYLEFVSRWGAS